MMLSAASDAEHARQTLGAASAGDQAEFDFRQRNVTPGAVTRYRQPSASSRPPPMATLWMAATTGLLDSSQARISDSRFGSATALGEPELLDVGAPENACWRLSPRLP